MTDRPDALYKRFYAKVNKDGPVQAHRPELGQCWEWTGSTDRWGYGSIKIGGRAGQATIATHIALELDGRPLQPGMWALHHCDNQRCVRPTHLYQGTQADNARDARARHRGANQHSVRKEVVA